MNVPAYSTKVKDVVNTDKWDAYLESLAAEKERSDTCTNKNGVRPYKWFIGYNTGGVCSLSQDLLDSLPGCQRPKVFDNPIDCVNHFLTVGVDINPELC